MQLRGLVTVIKLTDNELDDIEPSISADGTKVVYSSNDKFFNDFDIFIHNADGTGESRSISGIPHYYQPNDRYPTISNDGTRVAWIRENLDAPPGPPLLVTVYDVVSNYRYNYYFPEHGTVTGIKISGDGSRINYSVLHRKKEENCGIFTINFDGTNNQQLVPCESVPHNSTYELCGHYFADAETGNSVIPFHRCARHLSEYGIGILQPPDPNYQTIFSRSEQEPTFFACSSAPNGYNPPHENHEICTYSVSADGSKIVFTGAKVLETIPVGGTSLEELITDQDIYVINSDGTGLDRLTAE